ncbi:glycosyltransferase [Cereibacter sp. SYSU M97828]|nr:glycosyltransferase [Cereibacter flavus]
MNANFPTGQASALPAPFLQFSSGSTPFDVVLVTRNRPEALAFALPLLIAQSEQAQRIIVIDSSDDADPVQQLIAQQDVSIVHEHAARGSSHQRNLGLRHVTAPVVFFPGDAARCHPGTTEAMMRIYSRDADHRIAGVCAAGAGPISGPVPFHEMAHILQRAQSRPDWLAQEDAAPAPWLPAPRMSFRTDAIVDEGFDETFRSHDIHADVDASFKAMRHGILVEASRARIDPHPVPAERTVPFNAALMSALNLAFVMARHSADLPEAAAIRRATKSHLRARMRMLVPKFGSRRGRAEFHGTRTALAACDALFDAPQDLSRTYAALHDQLLK